jgi:NTP pyrophosphatase (non-canonical NTP hydrolase)
MVADIVSKNNLEISANNRLLDLISEVGELVKEHLKSTDYGSQEFSLTGAWKVELGDVFFALICLSNQTDVNLQEALEATLAKYQARLEHLGDLGSGG